MAETEERNTGRKPGTQQSRYAYYIRCERRKAGGGQCKAPAVKGTRVCYKHTQQDDAERRREQMIRALELPTVSDAGSMRTFLGKIAQALVDDRIDERCARYLFQRAQAAMFQARQGSRAGRGTKIMSSSNERDV